MPSQDNGVAVQSSLHQWDVTDLANGKEDYMRDTSFRYDTFDSVDESLEGPDKLLVDTKNAMIGFSVL